MNLFIIEVDARARLAAGNSASPWKDKCKHLAKLSSVLLASRPLAGGGGEVLDLHEQPLLLLRNRTKRQAMTRLEAE